MYANANEIIENFALVDKCIIESMIAAIDILHVHCDYVQFNPYELTNN